MKKGKKRINDQFGVVIGWRKMAFEMYREGIMLRKEGVKVVKFPHSTALSRSTMMTTL